MEVSPVLRPNLLLLLLLFSSLTTLFFQLSHSTTVVVVDGVSEWTNPTVLIGDSVIFRHKYDYKLYIFKNKRAFDLCNFTQSTLLTKPNSTTSFTWHPSRPGFFYYAFNNGSMATCNGQKLAIKVISQLPPPPLNSAHPPEVSPIAAPPPSAGGVVGSSPAFPWPFRPHESSSSSSPSPAPISVEMGSNNVPLINSNPAVPLPSGEVDSATIRPLTTSDHGGQVVGLLAVPTVLSWVVSLIML